MPLLRRERFGRIGSLPEEYGETIRLATAPTPNQGQVTVLDTLLSRDFVLRTLSQLGLPVVDDDDLLAVSLHRTEHDQ